MGVWKDLVVGLLCCCNSRGLFVSPVQCSAAVKNVHPKSFGIFW